MGYDMYIVKGRGGNNYFRVCSGDMGGLVQALEESGVDLNREIVRKRYTLDRKDRIIAVIEPEEISSFVGGKGHLTTKQPLAVCFGGLNDGWHATTKECRDMAEKLLKRYDPETKVGKALLDKMDPIEFDRIRRFAKFCERASRRGGFYVR